MDLSHGHPTAPPELGPTDHVADVTAPAHQYPPAGWPSKDQITYTKEAITTLFLVLALPYVVTRLLTNPGGLIAGIGRAKATG
jgi:hypothetical protein